MQRGDSFRSNGRVPTHIVCAFGDAMSIDKNLQAFGRATYIGKDELKKNGFDHVTALATAADFSSIRAYPEWLKEMETKLGSGKDVQQAMSSSEVYSDKANFLDGHRKPIGQIKNKLREKAEWTHDEPKPGEERTVVKQRKQKLVNDPFWRWVFKVMEGSAEDRSDVIKDDLSYLKQAGSSAEEIFALAKSEDDLDFVKPTKAQVAKALKDMCQDGLIQGTSDPKFGDLGKKVKPVRYWIIPG